MLDMEFRHFAYLNRNLSRYRIEEAQAQFVAVHGAPSIPEQEEARRVDNPAELASILAGWGV